MKLFVTSLEYAFDDNRFPVTKVEFIGAINVPTDGAFRGNPRALMTIEFAD
jgi:hypothetical protein